jgi:hypothetical protein
MNGIVDSYDEGQFANGQISRDLRDRTDGSERRGSQFLIDADERLSGHLRKLHLPRFESLRARENPIKLKNRKHVRTT